MRMRMAAALILGIEALGVVVLLVGQIGAIITGDVASMASALALAVLTLVGAAAVAGFAWGTARGQSWGRSGGIVVQALILAVAIGALTGSPPNFAAAGLIALPALVGGAVLLLTAREAGRRRDGS